MSIKQFLQKFLLKERASSERYISYLRKKGIRIGEDVRIYVPTKTLIDEQYPWMIEIGNHVRIAQGVIILTHDYSWYVLKGMTGEVLGSSGKVNIGNNVFIGMNAIITAGVTIADNVIIGAGSVVTKDCLANGIYAGNPAKKIMDIEEFYKRRRECQFTEAKALAREYFSCYGTIPDRDIFHEYFMLFSSFEEIQQNHIFFKKMENTKNSMNFLQTRKPLFDNFDCFIKSCFENDGV